VSPGLGAVRPARGETFPAEVEVLVVGGGACGHCAALAAVEAGAEVLVLERDPLPSGSTALSAGLIPAAGTRWQAERGVEDGPAAFAADIQAKAKGRADATLVRAVTEASAGVLHWLADAHGVPLSLQEGFRYPGHSVLRMHGTPLRTGSELMGHLGRAAGALGVDLLTETAVDTLFADEDGRVRGVEAARPDGTRERIGCRALVLACNGYGGNPDLVARHLPEMRDALYFGHPGNRGDALLWGEALGAATRHLTACQGHGSVAHPHGILVTWGAIMEGGVQVNAEGRRFADETTGYSEQAVPVLRQPGGVAWVVYDARIDAVCRQFEDYRNAHAQGAIRTAPDAAALEAACGLPPGALQTTLDEVAACTRGERQDPFGRRFDARSLLPDRPLHAVRVTGALFHTQGGLVVDAEARVLRPDGSRLPNLFAGGGAACGVSGPDVAGYLSGNGLLTAVTLGAISGRAAARAWTS
jgi:fumarate reductase flavoprotein subunit